MKTRIMFGEGAVTHTRPPDSIFTIGWAEQYDVHRCRDLPENSHLSFEDDYEEN